MGCLQRASREPWGQLGPLLSCCVIMAASDGAVSRQSRTGPLLSAAAQDRPVCRHVWDGPVPSPVTPGAAAAASLARLPHPHHVVTSLVVSQSPRLQERLAAALSLSRRSRRRQHLPASGGCPAAPSNLFPVTQAPTAGRLAFRRRVEEHQGNRRLSSLELRSGASGGGRCPGQNRPHPLEVGTGF